MPAMTMARTSLLPWVSMSHHRPRRQSRCLRLPVPAAPRCPESVPEALKQALLSLK